MRKVGIISCEAVYIRLSHPTRFKTKISPDSVADRQQVNLIHALIIQARGANAMSNQKALRIKLTTSES